MTKKQIKFIEYIKSYNIDEISNGKKKHKRHYDKS